MASGRVPSMRKQAVLFFANLVWVVVAMAVPTWLGLLGWTWIAVFAVAYAPGGALALRARKRLFHEASQQGGD